MKKILFLFFATILAGQVWAVNFDFKSGKLYYKIIDQNTVQLVANDTYKELVSVIIPETVTYKKKNYTVVEIANSAFSKCVKLKSVSIPESVTSIGVYAFVDCENLMSVTIPNTISEINEGTFYGCLKLESISIPASVIGIGDYAFADCENLISVTFPASVTNIGRGAFYNCANLKSVTIPNTISKINEGAFYGCLKLESISIPESVISIGNYAFAKCTNLKSVTIPESVKIIEAFAFYNCVNLKSVTIPNTISEIYEGTFGECSKLESVSIPNSILKIGRFAFYGCENLSGINIPNSVKEIADSAFAWCPKILTLNIPSSVEKIGKNAFIYCTNLKQVKIPASVKIIGEDAFSGCPKIKSVYCEVNQKPIGWDANWIADEPSSKTFARSEIIQWGGVDYSEIDQISEQAEMVLVGRLGTISARIGKAKDGNFYLYMSLHDDIKWPLDGKYLVVRGVEYASFEKNMAIVNEKYAKWTQTAKTDGVKNFRKTIVDFGDRIARMSMFDVRGKTKLYAVFEVDEYGRCLLKLGSQEIDDSEYAYSNYAPYYTFYSPEDFREFYEIIKYDNAMKNYGIMKSKIDAKKKAIEDRDAKFD